jgi:SpoVK/Ycf46/Vps4 family AAA+-type ATPase
MLKIDLAQLVSKWVGETEKNLEAAFQQAENSHAVLFFDEADALFGKRGDIKQGIDRYANLEVSFLLQRLEQSDSLVILASNLKENIDPAFTRRFHYIVNFPRPSLEERRRIWRLSFPQEAPLVPDIDLDTLAELDMTGAAIAGAARSAALLAADAGSPTITAAHIVAGVSRQYHRDTRLLRPEDLGKYARLADGALHG